MASIFERFAAGANRLAHAWNAFVDEDQQTNNRGYNQYGNSYSVRPDRHRLSASNDRSILASVLNRLAVDSAAKDIRHVDLDDQGRYANDVEDGLNNCLSIEANIDQAATAFKQDIFQTMLEKGCVAIVPIDTSLNPNSTGSYDIRTMRVGEIIQWYPRHIRVRLWNDQIGKFQEVTVAKTIAAISENPFYTVMNEPSSTLQRLIRKLNILDVVDEASSSGKLDLIIQLPYVIKSQARKDEAEKRAKDIEMQLRGSKYGIAYTDGTEHITQLNRPAENNLLAQITYLTDLLYSQLGLTEDIFNGKASESEMLNYENRTIGPIITAVIEAMKRSFLTKTARAQGESIESFRDPFKLVPLKDFGDLADKLIRNEIATANEVRGFMGMKPNSDPKADQLRNPNMPQQNSDGSPVTTDPNAPSGAAPDTSAQDDIFNQAMESIQSKVNALVGAGQ